MIDDRPTPAERTMTWIVMCVTGVLVVWGVARYGLSMEVQQRFWSNIFGRGDGPMTFRFLLQPAMAAIAAGHDGLKDAREGHKSFFWTAWWDPSQRTGRLREGLYSTARIMLLGIGMDVLYQHMVFEQFYPVEAVMIATLLAVLPYFIMRWLVEHVARWMQHRKPTEGGK